MSNQDVLVGEIQQQAATYLNRPPDELEDLFMTTWAEANAYSTAPVRGVDDVSFWRNFRRNLVANILRNRDLGSATLGFITSQVVGELVRQGIVLAGFQIPIAILVSLVAKAVWDSLEQQQNKNQPKNDPSKNE